jgi:negative regulator of sigma E activity
LVLQVTASMMGVLKMGDKALHNISTPTAQMSELISAAMDDEAHPSVLRHLSIASGDDTVRKQWWRYQLVSNVLKRQVETCCMDIALADRVRAAIQQQATHTDSLVPVPNRASWWHSLGSFAIAASVTLVMVLGLQQIVTSSQTDVTMAADGTNIVLIEPGLNNQQFEQTSMGTASADQVVQAKQRLVDTVLVPVTDAQWSVQNLPNGFVLTQRYLNNQADIAHEALRFSNGVEEFVLHIEPLMGRVITEGHVYAGDNLVLGKALVNPQGDVFVTLVGQLPLAAAQQVVASVTASTVVQAQ